MGTRQVRGAGCCDVTGGLSVAMIARNVTAYDQWSTKQFKFVSNSPQIDHQAIFKPLNADAPRERPTTDKMKETKMKKLAILTVLPLISACVAGGGSDSGEDSAAMASSRAVAVAVSGGQITPDSMGLGYNLADDGLNDFLLLTASGNVGGEDLGLTGSYGLTGAIFAGNNVVVAAAGGSAGLHDAFSIIQGTTEAIPTGDVTYQGHYTVAAHNAIVGHGTLDLQYGFSDNTLAGTSDDTRLGVIGVVDENGVISGTVDFDGTGMVMDGGIYGSNADELAAGFSNSDLGGYLFGERQ